MNIQSLPADRKDELFELLRLALGERQTVRRDQAFWAWKHEQNPFGPSLAAVAEEQGLLVGLRTFLRWQWRVENQLFQSIRAVDTATHPEHQRKGIFSKLTRAVLEQAQGNADFVFNTPNSNSLPGYLKMGWRKVGILPLYLKVLAPIDFVLGLGKTFLPGRDAGVDVDQIIGTRLPTAKEWLNVHAQEVAGLLDADRKLRGSGFSTARSADFLQWRYAAHPSIDYHVVASCSAGELQGLLCCRANQRKGLREVMITDLLLRQADSGLVRRMVATLSGVARADYLIAHFGPGSAHLSLLRQCGFRQVPRQGIDFTVRDLGVSVQPDPFVLSNWSLCLGDLELF